MYGRNFDNLFRPSDSNGFTAMNVFEKEFPEQQNTIPPRRRRVTRPEFARGSSFATKPISGQ